jgi:uncharacterized protein (DUF1778 family)
MHFRRPLGKSQKQLITVAASFQRHSATNFKLCGIFEEGKENFQGWQSIAS